MKVWIVISSSYESQCDTSTRVAYVCLSLARAKQRLKEISSFLSNCENVKTSETEISGSCGDWYYSNYIEEFNVDEE